MHKIILLLFFLMPAGVYAQTATPTPTNQPASYDSDCGNGLPCGQVPWSLPSFPQLESPTPAPTGGDEYASPGDTPTPTPDYLAQVTEVGSYADQLDLTGTPFNFTVDEETQYTEFTTNSIMIFSYIKTVFSIDFGVLTPLFVFLSITFTLTLLLKISTFMIPVIGAIGSIVRKIIELIPGF